MRKEWWKEAVIYQIYPSSFLDTTGSGSGDIRGIINKIDYIASLGVDVVWISPMYDSPWDDNGYDIRDYYKIAEKFGTMEEMKELIQALHDRGIKLLMDMVVNHTSDEHEWFVQSRSSKQNPYRDFYFWKESPNNWKSFFSGSAWELDDQTKEYYLHLFSKKQIDLNWENPRVVEEVHKIFKYWLELGVDGFRLDVISLISKRLDFPEIKEDMSWTDVIDNIYANGPRVHEYIQNLNRQVFASYPDLMTVGEGAGITLDVALDYVGEDRDEIDMIFQLEHMTNNYGVEGRFDYRKENLVEIKALFSKWDKIIDQGGWLNIFLDNHDFIRMLSRYGNTDEYHAASAKLLLTMICTLRGTPCIYYGSEIGMSNIELKSLEEVRDVESLNYAAEASEKGMSEEEILKRINYNGRDNARTPMQWSDEVNAGFTSGTPWLRVNPDYTSINVAKQVDDEDSILSYFKTLLSYRKKHDIFVYGEYVDLLPDHPNLFVYERNHEEETKLIILNMSDEPVPYSIDLMDYDIECNNYPHLEYNDGSIRLSPWQSIVLS